MDLNTRQLVWRTNILLRRSARARRQTLAREIASYTTPSERADLAAAIARCPDPGREEIRRLLARGLLG